MFSLLRPLLVTASLLISLQTNAISQDSKNSSIPTELVAADQLYRSGKFAEAEASYEAVLKTDSKSVPAKAGLVRAMLRQQKIDEAMAAVNNALAGQPNSAALLSVKGDVQFRRAEMPEAETSYLTAKKLDPKEFRADLGLLRLYRSYSLYGKAHTHLLSAHEIAPNDIEVQRAWMATLPRNERLVALEAYLSHPHPDDDEETRGMTEYVEFLKATADKPIHECRLVSKIEQTGIKLETMYAPDAQVMRGIGLSVKLNDRKVRLLLDTGAGGIMVSRQVAEKAGLVSISAVHYGGIGDKGMQSGHSAVAERVRIGELDFQDCVVSVADKRSVGNEDGLIGADVLGAYLIDLDLPGMQLKLSPLPKRPEAAVVPKSLNSEGEEQAMAEQKEERLDDQTSKVQNPSRSLPKPGGRVPPDRYVAPEMAAWTRVFRFGPTILVPTSVNNSRDMLFGLDTGGFTNILSVRAGKEMSKVSPDESMRIRGLSGEVKKVYNSTATLGFAHLLQPNLKIITLDLSNLSRHTGTEVSGFLGFSTLKLLDLQLDYRDGLVNFKFDPNRAGR